MRRTTLSARRKNRHALSDSPDTRLFVPASSFYTLLGVLVLLAQVALVAVLAINFVPKFRTLAVKLSRFALPAAAGVALAATLASLALSEIYHLPPCKLCWYQRIATYPLGILLPIAAFRKDLSIRFYATILALIGFIVSCYHILIERFPNLESGGSCDPQNPCSIVWWEKFGYITIPVGAGTCLVLVIALLALAKKSD